MKRILTIAFALVFVAVSSQAANVNWSIKNKSCSGWSINVYNGDITSTITSWTNDTLTEDAIMASLGSGVADSTSIKGTGKASGAIVGDIASTLTYVIYNTEAPTEGKTFYYATSSTSGYVYDASNQETAITPPEISAFTSATWDPKTVPEPTSVALIALGLAAFCLKRKVA